MHKTIVYVKGSQQAASILTDLGIGWMPLKFKESIWRTDPMSTSDADALVALLKERGVEASLWPSSTAPS